MAKASGRQFWVLIHRWAGLTIASFMVIVGITGAIIPWQGDLQRMIAPDRFVSPPTPDAKPLPSIKLWQIAQTRTGGVIDYIVLRRAADEPAAFSISAVPDAPPLTYDEILLNPYTGREIARDRAAHLGDGVVQILPFLYILHFELAMGEWGTWILGVAALVWTIDCFIGFYVSLPVTQHRWWRQFGKSWRVRWRSGGYRLNFDLHRAGGLWIWPMLLIFAWSSVGMNLRSVYNPVMTMLVGLPHDPVMPEPVRPSVRRLDMEQALLVARQRVAEETARRGLHVEWERAFSFDASSNSYSLVVRTERDVSDSGANSYFTIDAANGHLIGVALPTGEHSGSTIDYWIGQLHVAGVFGLPYRIFVTFVGLFLAVISVTGVVIWMKKRTARILGKRKPLLRRQRCL